MTAIEANPVEATVQRLCTLIDKALPWVARAVVDNSQCSGHGRRVMLMIEGELASIRGDEQRATQIARLEATEEDRLRNEVEQLSTDLDSSRTRVMKFEQLASQLITMRSATGESDAKLYGQLETLVNDGRH